MWALFVGEEIGEGLGTWRRAAAAVARPVVEGARARARGMKATDAAAAVARTRIWEEGGSIGLSYCPRCEPVGGVDVRTRGTRREEAREGDGSGGGRLGLSRSCVRPSRQAGLFSPVASPGFLLRPCLVHSEIQKLFKILRHIKFYSTYIKH